MILVGEMSDLETIGTALTAAETGHLVFATLHTQDAPKTIDRIIDVFPPTSRSRSACSSPPRSRASSRSSCCPRATATGGSWPAEVLVPTPAVRNLIREGKTHQIYSVMQTGSQHGMQTMDSALADLVRRGVISRELAERRSSTPEDLEALLGQLGGVAAR